MQTIKAIETRYKGYRFRSRLEARWAVFFDALGIDFCYEEHGFDLDGLRYLPDFWLPFRIQDTCDVPLMPPQKGYFVEVKPCPLTVEEQEKLKKLSMMTHHHCYAFSGSPYPGELAIYSFWRQSGSVGPYVMSRIHLPGECGFCNGSGISDYGGGIITESWKGVDFEIVVGGPCGRCNGTRKVEYLDSLSHLLYGFMWNLRDEVTTYDDLQLAFTAARSARFEHGESG